MSAGGWLPSARDVVRQGFLMVGGAIVVAVILYKIPKVREWMQAQNALGR